MATTILLTDTFESYSVGLLTSSGMAAAGYTWSSGAQEPSISIAQAHGGTKSVRSTTGAIQHLGLTSGTRSGTASGWGYRDTTIPNPNIHGTGIQPLHPLVGESFGRFGVRDDYYGTQFPTAGAGPNDLVFWYTWLTPGPEFAYQSRTIVAPNVYRDNTWQHFVLEWTLSSFNATTGFINQDGCVRITVDDAVVVNQTGLYLTLRDNWNDWRETGNRPTDNTWEGIYYAWGGYLDDIQVTNAALCETSTTRVPPVVTPSTNCPCPAPDTKGPTGGSGGGGGGGTPSGGSGFTPPTGTGPIGGGGSGKSGTNEGGLGWTPAALCPGGGTVGSYPLASAGESMAGCREDRVWVEAAFQTFDGENETTTTADVWAVDQTIPSVPSFSSATNSRARAAGRLFGLGKITRGMSDDNGNYAGVSFGVRLDDKDRAALRTRLGDEAERYVWDREIRAYIASETNRRTGFSTPPRELARCLTKDIALDRGFTGSIQCEDRLISQFGAFGPDRSFSSRLLTAGLLAGLPRDLIGKPQQWIFGEVSDEGATDPTTGLANAKGLVPIWLVGSIGSEDEYHLCAHDICGLTLYGSDGGSPPKRVLLTDYRYETINLTDSVTGLTHRMTHIYLPTGSVASEAHKSGQLNMAANVGGVLGSNGLLITDLFAIYQYVFEHLLLPEQESLTGVYAGSPQWADGRYMVDSASFADAQAFSAQRIGGRGYQGGFVLGGPGQGAVPLRELLRRMSNSGDCWFTWTAGGQLRVVLLDDAAAVDDSPLLTEPAQMRALPTPNFSREEVENPVLFAYDYDDDKQRFRVAQESVEEERARKRMGQPKPSPSPIAMRCTRDAATARDVAQRRLLRRKYPPAYYPVVEPLDGLDRNPGDVIRINSIEGVGAGSAQRALWIRETSYDQATRRVTHLCRDLTDIIGTAAFAAGDEVPTYVLGTAEQQAKYVFAADDDGLVTAGGGGRVVAKGAR